jgi:uncharacterized DUF497 family protein
MRIEYDTDKREATLRDRGLDFVDAAEIFGQLIAEFEDDRKDYGESRFVSVGYLGQRLAIVVWTPRGDGRRIVSMRRANEREERIYLGS